MSDELRHTPPQEGIPRAEFWRGIEGTKRTVGQEAAGLRESVGWACISLGFWFLLIGWCWVKAGMAR